MAQGHHLLDRGVALVEKVGDDGGIAVQTQGKLGQVIRADRKTVEQLKELLCEYGIGRNFATS